MKYLVSFYFLLFFFFSLPAQPLATSKNAPGPVGNTYAVIIGISAYQDTDIKQLEFSNRDAVFFANFLMSESGGSVPNAHIRLLIDSVATTGEIEKAMQWLKATCKKDDKVYFYFSGHGELENLTMNEDGYLICYNTTSAAFVNLGFSIRRLNGFANTLSIQNKANVIIITDACHSGKLVDDNIRGNNFVREQLVSVKNKEIRMASSAAGQLSIENTDWGGGRGVFSYHLINGLQGGLADKGNDGIVTLGELKTYIENSMANDVVLKKIGEVQTPVIPVLKENIDFPLSKVVPAEAYKIKQQVNEDSVLNAMVIEAMRISQEERLADPEEYFFYLLEKEDLESLTRSLKLDSVEADEIAFRLINRIESSQPAENTIKLKELRSILKDSERFRRFKVSLGRNINDEVLQVIGQYIKGDEAELERRRYYNSNNKGYDIYPKMLAVVLKSSESDEDLARSASVLFHYFKGVTLRLKIPLTKDWEPLIAQALNEQKEALKQEEHAAYIYNELGILYQYKEENAEAEKYYIKATEFSPGWAIPYSNLCGLYGALKRYEKAMAACHIADSLQAGLQSVAVNLGFINERTGNQLFAEEYYRNAIEINSRHYLPFERLGYVYTNTTAYAAADSFFYEADLRKKGYHFDGNEWGSPIWWDDPLDYYYFECRVDTSILDKRDIFAFFTWGVQEYEKKKFTNAVRILQKVVNLDKTNPLVFHYLGKAYFDQQKWEEAEVMFKFAIQYSKNKIEFKQYVDSVKTSTVYPYKHSCFEEFFTKKYYDQIEDYYFAGTLYENWKHVEEAETYFKHIIELDSLDIGGYLKLWRLYEKQGLYTEAEEVIKKYAPINKEQSERELNTFYRRTIEKFPDDGDWNYRLGLLLYSRAAVQSRAPYLDTIVLFPKINKEIFIDINMYYKISTTNDLRLYDKLSTGAPQEVTLNFKQEVPKQYTIPGTKETLKLADAIYLPRKDGIKYLSRAAELIPESEILADINFKIGNIYVWAGSKKQAYPFFEKSIAMVPGNANARLTLIDIYTTLFKNRAALEQLNYLYDSSQINFPKRLLLAQFNIHTGQFEKANKLLEEAESIYPFVVPQIADLRGRLKILEEKPKEAIAFYEKYLKQDSSNIDNRKSMPAYTIARLYAKTGKTNEAFKWLETAINYGFNYSFVLKNDPLMETLRKTAKWKTMVGNISIKKYQSNFAAN